MQLLFLMAATALTGPMMEVQGQKVSGKKLAVGVQPPEFRLGHHRYNGRVKQVIATEPATVFLHTNGRYVTYAQDGFKVLAPKDTLASIRWREASADLAVVRIETMQKTITQYDAQGFEQRSQVYLGDVLVSDVTTTRDQMHRPIKSVDKINRWTKALETNHRYENG